MPYMNETTILGHAGREPELSYLQSGQAICKFSVAVSRGKDKPTDWFNVVAFGKTGEIAAEQIKKGIVVLVKGQMQSNKYEEKMYWNLIANRIYTFTKPETKPSSPPADWSNLGQEIDLGDSEEIPF